MMISRNIAEQCSHRSCNSPDGIRRAHQQRYPQQHDELLELAWFGRCRACIGLLGACHCIFVVGKLERVVGLNAS